MAITIDKLVARALPVTIDIITITRPTVAKITAKPKSSRGILDVFVFAWDVTVIGTVIIFYALVVIRF
jgi:hypothetical protein